MNLTGEQTAQCGLDETVYAGLDLAICREIARRRWTGKKGRPSQAAREALEFLLARSIRRGFGAAFIPTLKMWAEGMGKNAISEPSKAIKELKAANVIQEYPDGVYWINAQLNDWLVPLAPELGPEWSEHRTNFELPADPPELKLMMRDCVMISAAGKEPGIRRFSDLTARDQGASLSCQPEQAGRSQELGTDTAVVKHGDSMRSQTGQQMPPLSDPPAAVFSLPVHFGTGVSKPQTEKEKMDEKRSGQRPEDKSHLNSFQDKCKSMEAPECTAGASVPQDETLEEKLDRLRKVYPGAGNIEHRTPNIEHRIDEAVNLKLTSQGLDPMPDGSGESVNLKLTRHGLDSKSDQNPNKSGVDGEVNFKLSSPSVSPANFPPLESPLGNVPKNVNVRRSAPSHEGTGTLRNGPEGCLLRKTKAEEARLLALIEEHVGKADMEKSYFTWRCLIAWQVRSEVIEAAARDLVDRMNNRFLPKVGNRAAMMMTNVARGAGLKSIGELRYREEMRPV